MQSGHYNSPRTNPNNVTFVRGLGDFPAPVANVITLLANHTYIIETSVDIEDNQLVPQSFTSLAGYAAGTSILVGSHATALVNFDTPGFVLAADLTFNNSVGDAIILNSNVIANLNNVSFVSGNIIATSFNILNIESGLFLNDAGINVNADNPISRITMERVAFFQSNAVNSIAIGSGFSLGIMTISTTSFNTVLGGVGISLADNDTQVGQGSILLSTFTGAGELTENFTEISDNWQITDTSGNADSCDSGVTNFDVLTAKSVVINTVDVWEDIADGGVAIIYSIEDIPQKFTLNDADNGEMIYNGVRDRCFKIGGTVNLEGQDGTEVAEIGISKNGNVPVDSTHSIAVINNTRRNSVSIIPVPIALTFGDTIKIQVRNQTGTTNIDFFQSKVSAFF